VSEQTSTQRPRRVVKWYSRWYRTYLVLYLFPFVSLFSPITLLAERFDWRAVFALGCGVACTAFHVASGRVTTKRLFVITLLAMLGAFVVCGVLLNAASKAGLS